MNLKTNSAERVVEATHSHLSNLVPAGCVMDVVSGGTLKTPGVSTASCPESVGPFT